VSKFFPGEDPSRGKRLEVFKGRPGGAGFGMLYEECCDITADNLGSRGGGAMTLIYVALHLQV
jgi:hypothetical protein